MCLVQIERYVICTDQTVFCPKTANPTLCVQTPSSPSLPEGFITGNISGQNDSEEHNGDRCVHPPIVLLSSASGAVHAPAGKFQFQFSSVTASLA